MKLSLNEIKAPHRKERDHKNLSNLVDSIREIGMIEPIVVNERNEIIAGRRRFYAARELKLPKVEVVYFEKSAVDQELASIDSNLMTLPLGDVDHDQALARRKKLYEQKYPETRQYATGGGEKGKSFTKDVADVIGITRRSVELAIVRAEKSSPAVNTARREGRLSPTVVNELVRLPTEYQNKLLHSVEGKSVAQVKNIVNMALEKDADYAAVRANRAGDKTSSIELVSRNLEKLKESLLNAFKHKVKCEPMEMKSLVQRADEVISLLEKFIVQNTPVHKPILRKQEAIAS